MARKISLATAAKEHGWLGVDSYKKLVDDGKLENFPTPGGHTRIDEDELLDMIEGRPKMRTAKPSTAGFDQVLRETIAAMKRKRQEEQDAEVC